MATTPYQDTMVDPLDSTPGDDAELGVDQTGGGKGLGETARGLASTMSDAAAGVGPKISEAAGSTADAVREADLAIRSTSDQALGMVGALSIGSAIGLLVGGANRFLVAIALVPAILVAKAIVERMDQSGDRALR